MIHIIYPELDGSCNTATPFFTSNNLNQLAGKVPNSSVFSWLLSLSSAFLYISVEHSMIKAADICVPTLQHIYSFQLLTGFGIFASSSPYTRQLRTATAPVSQDLKAKETIFTFRHTVYKGKTIWAAATILFTCVFCILSLTKLFGKKQHITIRSFIFKFSRHFSVFSIRMYKWSPGSSGVNNIIHTAWI